MRKTGRLLMATVLLTTAVSQTAMAEWKQEKAGVYSYQKENTETDEDGVLRWSDGTEMGAESENWKERCYVNCNEFITLRETPSTSAAEIYKIPRGQEIEVLEVPKEGEEFVKVKYREREGYVLGSYLTSRAEYIKSVTPMRVVKCNESITLRALPGSSSQEITQIPKGEPVLALGKRQQGFHRVAYEKIEKDKSEIYFGWAMSSYLEVDQEAIKTAEKQKAIKNKERIDRLQKLEKKKNAETQPSQAENGVAESGSAEDGAAQDESNPEETESEKASGEVKEKKSGEDLKETKKDEEKNTEEVKETEKAKGSEETEKSDETGKEGEDTKKKKKKFKLPKFKLPEFKLPKFKSSKVQSSKVQLPKV